VIQLQNELSFAVHTGAVTVTASLTVRSIWPERLGNPATACPTRHPILVTHEPKNHVGQRLTSVARFGTGFSSTGESLGLWMYPIVGNFGIK
jgi:hypothetical protein